MKIFISHTKQDNDLAQIIVGALEKFKVDHWVDFDQLEKGGRLIRKINDGLKTSTHFMLIWTEICQDDYKNYIPIFIPLGQLPKHNDLKDHLKIDIREFIAKEYKFTISADQFDKELVDGNFIFILDALDEMSKKLDSDIAQRNLNHVLTLSKNSMTLLTSRHTYISTAIERKLLIDYNRLIKILDFSEKEIEKYLHLYFGDEETRIQ